MEKYLNALEEILNNYDAFFINNKYGDMKENTHKEQFELLISLFKDDELSMRAINWIKNCYDCYYKSEVENDDNTAFGHLKKEIMKKGKL